MRIATASLGLEPAELAQDLRAARAVDELHHDVLAAGRLLGAEVEDLDDVRVHEPRGGERLAAEARDEVGVRRQVLGEQLDGHVALQPRVERELDRGHAADAEPALEAVAVGEERLGGHPSSSGEHRRCPLVPRAARRPSGVDGGGRGRRRRRRASASPSASASGSASPSASASRSASAVGVGVSSGSGASHSAAMRLVEVVEPVGQVRLELPCRSCAAARRAALGLARRPRRARSHSPAAEASPASLTSARQLVGVLLRDQRGFVAAAAGERERGASAAARSGERDGMAGPG